MKNCFFSKSSSFSLHAHTVKYIYMYTHSQLHMQYTYIMYIHVHVHGIAQMSSFLISITIMNLHIHMYMYQLSNRCSIHSHKVELNLPLNELILAIEKREPLLHHGLLVFLVTCIQTYTPCTRTLIDNTFAQEFKQSNADRCTQESEKTCMYMSIHGRRGVRGKYIHVHELYMYIYT